MFCLIKKGKYCPTFQQFGNRYFIGWINFQFKISDMPNTKRYIWIK